MSTTYIAKQPELKNDYLYAAINFKELGLKGVLLFAPGGECLGVFRSLEAAQAYASFLYKNKITEIHFFEEFNKRIEALTSETDLQKRDEFKRIWKKFNSYYLSKSEFDMEHGNALDQALSQINCDELRAQAQSKEESGLESTLTR